MPDALSIALKTLSNHIRLRILKLIKESPLTQSEIAKELRLRALTVSHHIKTLRLAGMIQFIDSSGDDIRYGVRAFRIENMCGLLKGFLSLDQTPP